MRELIKETTKMKKFTVARSDEADIRFRGEHLGSVANDWLNGNKQEGWFELSIWQTVAGTFVVRRSQCSQWASFQGYAGKRHETVLVETTAEILEFLGFGELAKELYDKCKIEATVSIG